MHSYTDRYYLVLNQNKTCKLEYNNNSRCQTLHYVFFFLSCMCYKYFFCEITKSTIGTRMRVQYVIYIYIFLTSINKDNLNTIFCRKQCLTRIYDILKQLLNENIIMTIGKEPTWSICFRTFYVYLPCHIKCILEKSENRSFENKNDKLHGKHS